MSGGPCPGGCQETIGLLSAQLRIETAASETMARVIAAMSDRIDQLEHELAVARGPALELDGPPDDAGERLVEDVAQYLKDQHR